MRHGNKSNNQKSSDPQASSNPTFDGGLAQTEGEAANSSSVEAQLVSSQPVSSQPASSQPVSSQLVSSQLVSSQPVSSQPVSSQPVSSQLVSSQQGRARFDRPGHLAEEHAQRLLRMSKRKPPDDVAFVMANRGNTDDEFAEELAEHAVSTMTTGGDTWMDFMDKTVEEEDGGPFVETRASREFAHGSEHEVDGFLREALPTTRSGVKGRTQGRR
jgi:hypothetical protein